MEGIDFKGTLGKTDKKKVKTGFLEGNYSSLFQIAAQNCRKRKTDQIAVLEDEVGGVWNVTNMWGMRKLVYVRSGLPPLNLLLP